MKQKAVIFDVDGTLCDVRGIRHMVRGEHRNFDAFHSASIDCPAHLWVVEAARLYHSRGFAVLVVTARDAKHFYTTMLWLAEQDIPYDDLYMRPRGDGRPDHVVKAEILAQIEQRYDVLRAFDDHPSVIDLWRSHGIPVTVVPGWLDKPVEV